MRLFTRNHKCGLACGLFLFTVFIRSHTAAVDENQPASIDVSDLEVSAQQQLIEASIDAHMGPLVDESNLRDELVFEGDEFKSKTMRKEDEEALKPSHVEETLEELAARLRKRAEGGALSEAERITQKVETSILEAEALLIDDESGDKQWQTLISRGPRALRFEDGDSVGLSSVLVITMDGRLSSLNILTGEVNWSVPTGGNIVVSTTSSSNNPGMMTVATLDGNLMAYREGYGFASLDKQELFGSTKPFTTNDNGRCITTKETRLLRVDAMTGNVTADSSAKFSPREHKCPASAPHTSLFVTRSDFGIRCFDDLLGTERWSSSIAEFDIQLEAKAKQGPSPPMHQLPELAASIDGDLFALRPGSNEVLWEARFNSPVSVASLRTLVLGRLQRVPRVKQYQEGTRTSDGSIDPSSMDVRHGMQALTSEPKIHFRSHEGQLYAVTSAQGELRPMYGLLRDAGSFHSYLLEHTSPGVDALNQRDIGYYPSVIPVGDMPIQAPKPGIPGVPGMHPLPNAIEFIKEGKTATKLAPTGDLGFASLDEIWMLLSDIWALASVFMLVLVSLLVYFWNQPESLASHDKETYKGFPAPTSRGRKSVDAHSFLKDGSRNDTGKENSSGGNAALDAGGTQEVSETGRDGSDASLFGSTNPVEGSSTPVVGRHSRYKEEYEELERLGRGAFGAVFRVRNKVDGNEYAIKKVRIKSAKMNQVREEVGIISKLDHSNVIRYYTSWFEDDDGATDRSGDNTSTEGGDTTTDGSPGRMKGSFTLGTASVSEASKTQNWPARYQWSLTGEELLEEQGKEEPANQVRQAAVDEWVFNGESSSESGFHLNKRAHGDDPVQSSVHQGDTQRNEQPQTTGQAEGTMRILYIQMQLCESTNLFDWLQMPNRKVVPGTDGHRECLDKFRQVVEGLRYVHEKRLIHRDLKPANVLMLKEPGRNIMKLADFGLSRSLPHSHLLEEIHQHRGEYLPEMRDNDRSLTMGIGTPTYISPELLKKHGDGRCTYTAMADIFSLGIILCEMFNPFETGMERARVLTQVRSAAVPPHMEAYFPQETLLMRAMLSNDPLERPSAADILENQVFNILHQGSPQRFVRSLSDPAQYIAQQQQELALVVRASSTESPNLPERILSAIHEWGRDLPSTALPSGWQSNVDKGGDVMVLRYTFSGGVPLEATHNLKKEVQAQFGLASVELEITGSASARREAAPASF